MALPVLPLVLGTAAAGLAAVFGYRYLQSGGDVPEFLPFGDPLSTFAKAEGIDPRLLASVIQVESAGVPLIQGRPVIRVEVHRLERTAAKLGKSAELARVFSRSSAPGQPWTGHQFEGEPLHQRAGEGMASAQRREYRALQAAADILGDEAYESASYGLGQIMGSNYALAGEPSAKAMLESAKKGKNAQIRHMLTFIKNDKNGRTLGALQAANVPLFVQYYNGAKVGTDKNKRYTRKIFEGMQ